MRFLGALVALLVFPQTGVCDCLRLSPGGAKELADSIQRKVRYIESNRPNPIARPTLLLKPVQEFGRPDATVVEGGSSIRSDAERRGCVDGVQVVRGIMNASQQNDYPIAFVSHATDDAVRDVLDRINRIGYGNMDAGTVSVLRARDVNYVVVIGGQSKAVRSKCTYAFRLAAEFDIHSVGTREFVAASSEARLVPDSPDRYLEIRAHEGSNGAAGRIELRSRSPFPVCIGEAEISANQYTMKWKQDVGCMPGQGSLTIRPPDSREKAYLPATGSITIEPTDNCDTFELEDVPLRRVMGLPAGSPSPTIPGPGSQGFPAGYILQGCGCWGYAQFYTPFPWNQCASGAAVHLPCPVPCSAGGQSYGTQCR